MCSPCGVQVCRATLTLPAAFRGSMHALEHRLCQARRRRWPLLCLRRSGRIRGCCRRCDAVIAASSAADDELLQLRVGS